MMNVQWSRSGKKQVCSLSELDALLDDLQCIYGVDRPALVTIEAPENRGTLTIGLGLDVSVLNHVSESGEPPYLSSVGATNSDTFIVFYYMGEWTEIPKRHLIPIDIAREGIRHYFNTGKLLDKIRWEEDCYNLYQDYSGGGLLSANSPTQLYVESDVTLVDTTDGARLFAKLDTPHSWSSPLPANLPYFLTPERLYWYSKWDNWSNTVLHGNRLERQPSPLLNSILLFAKNAGTDLFTYLGRGSMVGSGTAGPQCFLLCYRIKPKLSKETWVTVGGYSGWLLTLGRSEINLSSFGAGADLIKSQWGNVKPYLRITRYEGDILQAATNAQGRAVVSYLSSDDSAEHFSGHYDPTDQWVSFPHENGDTWEVPLSTVIHRKDALSIIWSYLSKGYPVGIGDVH